MTKSSNTQAPERPATPESEHTALEVFVGRWKIEGQQHDGPFGPAAKFTAVETYDWLAGGLFLVHRLDGRFGENDVACIEIIGHDLSSHTYPAHAFYNDGTTNEWHISENDGTWTLAGDSPVAGESLKVRCTTVFSDAGNTRTGRWEYSSDGTNWQLFLDARGKKGVPAVQTTTS